MLASCIYVDRTSRYFTTRNLEPQKKDSPVGQHLVECYGAAHNIEWEIQSACRRIDKLMELKAIYIKKLEPQINTGR